MDTREELKRKLKAKIHGKRNNSTQNFTQELKNDPVSALLNMGVTDPDILKMSSAMTSKNAQSTLEQMKQALKYTVMEDLSQESLPPDTDRKDLVPGLESDEEGLPPSDRESDEEGLPPPDRESDEEGLPP